MQHKNLNKNNWMNTCNTNLATTGLPKQGKSYRSPQVIAGLFVHHLTKNITNSGCESTVNTNNDN